VPSFSSTPNPPSATSTQQPSLSDSPLPSDLLNSYQSSIHILRTTFAQSPPYTIQRLAELILHPRRHYRFLPPFLCALDRAVSVTSPISDFPLPQVQATSTAGFLANGDSTNGLGERGALGSDEALGGALLTPITWIKKPVTNDDDTLPNNLDPAGADAAGADQQLKTEEEATIDGPNGAGRVETVSVTTNGFSGSGSHQPAAVTGDGDGAESTSLHQQELRSQGAVTQGELLRQEQTAGVVPVGQEVPRNPLLAGAGAAAVGREPASGPVDTNAGDMDIDEAEKPVEERPHPRGPELIGMEDTGPQATGNSSGRALDMEAAAGRKSPPHTSSPPIEESQQSIASVIEKKEGDPFLVEGNQGGVAETAAAEGEEKRKRTDDEDGKAEEKKVADHGDEDKEMTDA